ncbi:MAG: YerC/YecD family TrpR-related protein, partial [Gemmatimonadaceae bacterium]|nr:YerC/YecD family TrpR-related protein [Gemmatimonadaceae bacterium]
YLDKVNMKNNMKNWDNKTTEDLFRSILKLENVKETKRFFRDLLTEEENIEFGKRWQAARMLNENISYKKIVKKTGLSSRTVARISKWLNQGMGGYKLMLKKLNHHHNLSPSGKGLR